MTRFVIDPITRIEGHLRAEMEVTDGVVTDAWISGGCFRGMELVVRDRTPEDAAYIVQRICGVCPVSHMHSASIAAEQALGITIPNNARIVRNLIEGAQFLHSHILWLYNLAGLDYVNPLNALGADAADAYDLAAATGHPVRRLRWPAGSPEEVRRQRPALHLQRQLVRHRRVQHDSRGRPYPHRSLSGSPADAVEGFQRSRRCSVARCLTS